MCGLFCQQAGRFEIILYKLNESNLTNGLLETGDLCNRTTIRLRGGRELGEGIVSHEDLGVSARFREAKTGARGRTLASVGRPNLLLAIRQLPGNYCPGLVWIGPQAPLGWRLEM